MFGLAKMKLFSLFLFFLSSAIFAQSPAPAIGSQPFPDSSAKSHSPKKAIILSAIFPGGGQFYNKKYWKIPVIYAAGGLFVYYAAKNNKEYASFRKGYQLLADTSKRFQSVFIKNQEYNADQCKSNRNLFRRQRDLNIFATVLIYALNIIDANVDGHFYEFDMSDNLSLQLKPSVDRMQTYNYYCIHLNLNFK